MMDKKNMMTKRTIVAVALMMTLGLTGCGDKEKASAPSQVLAKVKDFDAAGRVAQWLSRPENAERVGERLVEVGRWAVGALNDERVRLFVADLARRGLKQVDITRLTGQVLEAMTHEGRHQELLDGVLVQLAKLLSEDAVQHTLTEAIASALTRVRWRRPRWLRSRCHMLLSTCG